MTIKFLPWHPSDPEDCNEVLDAKGRTIAVVEEWSNENREHVKLLAAAPELLKALEQILKDGCFEPESNIGHICEAAIAKAKGVQS